MSVIKNRNKNIIKNVRERKNVRKKKSQRYYYVRVY